MPNAAMSVVPSIENTVILFAKERYRKREALVGVLSILYSLWEAAGEVMDKDGKYFKKKYRPAFLLQKRSNLPKKALHNIRNKLRKHLFQNNNNNTTTIKYE